MKLIFHTFLLVYIVTKNTVKSNEFLEPGIGWIEKIDDDDNFETHSRRTRRAAAPYIPKPCHNRQFIDSTTSKCRSAYELKCLHNSMNFKIYKEYLLQENLTKDNIFFETVININSTCYKFIDENSSFIEAQFYLNSSCGTTSEWIKNTTVIYKNSLTLKGNAVNYINAKAINFTCDYRTNYTTTSCTAGYYLTPNNTCEYKICICNNGTEAQGSDSCFRASRATDSVRAVPFRAR